MKEKTTDCRDQRMRISQMEKESQATKAQRDALLVNERKWEKAMEQLQYASQVNEEQYQRRYDARETEYQRQYNDLDKKFQIKNTSPIYNTYHTTTDMYYKGSWILHTLRTVLNNDALWYSLLKGLQSEFKHKTLNTSMVIKYIEVKSGVNLESFFQQYLFQAELPIFEYFFQDL